MQNRMMFFLLVAAMAVLFAVILFADVGTENDPLPQTGAEVSDDLLRHIKQVCEINGVDPLVVVAIINRESNFEPGVTNQSTGCAGLMQLHPATLEWLERETGCRYDPYDPFQNVAGGVYLLSWLLQRYDGDYDMALFAYAEGYGAAERRVIAGVDPSKTWQARTIMDAIRSYVPRDRSIRRVCYSHSGKEFMNYRKEIARMCD